MTKKHYKSHEGIDPVTKGMARNVPSLPIRTKEDHAKQKQSEAKPHPKIVALYQKIISEIASLRGKYDRPSHDRRQELHKACTDLENQMMQDGTPLTMELFEESTADDDE